MTTTSSPPAPTPPDPTGPPAAPPARTPRSPRKPGGGGGLFRALWRWHFFASFLIVPVLLVLSATGLIYLFRFQIEPLLHADVMRVSQPADVDFSQPYSAQLASVERDYPDATVVSMTEPEEVDHSTRFSVTTADGDPLDVFVDPWRAEVLGAVDPDTTVSGIAVALHADLMSGTVGDRIMELGASWALVSALMGYYLVVKGRAARKRQQKSRRPGARLRSWHARIGVVAGVGLLLLLVSGLPWTGVFGGTVQQIATSNGSSMWSQDHGALSDPTSRLDESLPHSHDVPWGAGATQVPRSDPDGADDHLSVASVDTAVLVAEREGLRHPMTIALPADDDGVFSVIGYAFDAPSDERTVHVDRFGGDVVSTYGFDDYPTLAKVVSHGIGLHEGRSLGLWSFWGAALMCVVIMAACVTGPLMFLKRRRKGGGLGAPRGRLPLRTSPVLAVAVVVLGVLLPLFGLTVLLLLAADHLVVRRTPWLRERLGSV